MVESAQSPVGIWGVGGECAQKDHASADQVGEQQSVGFDIKLLTVNKYGVRGGQWN